MRIGQRIDGEDDARRHVRHRAHPEARGRRAGLRAGTWDVVGGTSWLWAREELEGDARRPVRGRGRAAVAGHGVRRRGRRRVGRPARRSEPAAAGLAGHAPRGRGRVRARAPRRRGEDDPAGPRAAARDDVPPPPGGQRLRLGRLLRGPAGDRTRARRSSASRTARRWAASGIRFVPDAHDRRLEPVARGGAPGSPTPSRRCVGRRWIDQKGDDRAARGRRHHHRRALQRAGRGDRAGREGADSASTRTSAPSTSSRAARARSRSTR